MLICVFYTGHFMHFQWNNSKLLLINFQRQTWHGPLPEIPCIVLTHLIFVCQGSTVGISSVSVCLWKFRWEVPFSYNGMKKIMSTTLWGIRSQFYHIFSILIFFGWDVGPVGIPAILRRKNTKSTFIAISCKSLFAHQDGTGRVGVWAILKYLGLKNSVKLWSHP